MAQDPDQFCGNCGKPRVAGMSVCPNCGNPFEGLSSTSLENLPTRITPTEVAPKLTQPIWGNNTSPPVYPGSTAPTLPAPPPGPPSSRKSLPLGKILIGQGVAIALLLVLVVVLLVRPSTNGNPANAGTTTGSGVATGATATTGPAATIAPTATTAPTATATPAPKPGDLLCNVDIGTWSGGSSDWKLLNGRLLNDGSLDNDGGDGPTKVAPCQLGNITNYAVETKIQVTEALFGWSTFGITVRGTPSSGGWHGYAACIAAGYSCGDGASLGAVNGNNFASVSFSAGTDVHTYRVEVKDNVINFLIDGGLVVTLTDNEFLTGSQVGLWCRNMQLEVFSFQVFAL
jgi:hypothetical protein